MITEQGIRAGIKRAAENGKAVELRDGGLRGEGRLTLVIRKIGDRQPTAEWFAQW